MRLVMPEGTQQVSLGTQQGSFEVSGNSAEFLTETGSGNGSGARAGACAGVRDTPPCDKAA